MSTSLAADSSTFYTSTGHLPPDEMVRNLVHDAYRRFRSNADGRNSQVYPALAAAPADLFGSGSFTTASPGSPAASCR
jgi:glutaminase